MNVFQLPFLMFANLLVKTRFRRIVTNDAYAKLLIIIGALKWYDLPHLHHPLIHYKIDIEFRRGN